MAGINAHNREILRRFITGEEEGAVCNSRQRLIKELKLLWDTL